MTGARWRKYLGEHLHQSLTFEIEIGPGRGHGRIQGCVSEPLTDRREVNSGLQQEDGRRMPKRMGMDSLPFQSVDFGSSGFDVLLEQVPNAEPGKLRTVAVYE